MLLLYLLSVWKYWERDAIEKYRERERDERQRERERERDIQRVVKWMRDKKRER